MDPRGGWITRVFASCAWPPSPPSLPDPCNPPSLTGGPPSAPLPSPSDVARWMLAELARRGDLHEPTAALEIVRLFGGTFCDAASDGRFTIAPEVLDAFARASLLGEKEVVWSDEEHVWRFTPRSPRPYR
jgi:hypothetical protein